VLHDEEGFLLHHLPVWILMIYKQDLLFLLQMNLWNPRMHLLYFELKFHFVFIWQGSSLFGVNLNFDQISLPLHVLLYHNLHDCDGLQPICKKLAKKFCAKTDYPTFCLGMRPKIYKFWLFGSFWHFSSFFCFLALFWAFLALVGLCNDFFHILLSYLQSWSQQLYFDMSQAYIWVTNGIFIFWWPSMKT